MRTARLKYYFCLLVVPLALAGCSDDAVRDAGLGEAMPLESVAGLRLETSAAVVADRSMRGGGALVPDAGDPTLTGLDIRAAMGHTLKIALGTGNAETYGYAGGVWVPADEPLYFPSYGGTYTLNLEMRTGEEDAVGAQDGSAAGILAADELKTTLYSQSPVRNISGVRLMHANYLLDFTCEGFSPDEFADAEILIGDNIVPYFTGDGFNAIVRPGAGTVGISVVVGTVSYDCGIAAPDGEFLANRRYVFRLVFDGTELRVGGIYVAGWDEKEPVEIPVEKPDGGEARLRIEGYENEELTVRFSDGSSVVAELDSDGSIAVDELCVPEGAFIKTVQASGAGMPLLNIGRYGGNDIELKITGPDVAARKDKDGNILINTVAELMKIGTGVFYLSANYLQTSDVVLNGAMLRPVGGFDSSFAGVYDGGGYSIMRLELNHPEQSLIGLFAENNGTLKNIRISGDNMAAGEGTVGLLCGMNNSGIYNCSVSGSATGDFMVGGICGFNLGVISGCENNASVYADMWGGGIAGYNMGAVEACVNKGSVRGGSAIGGMAGSNDGATITASYNVGEISGDDVCGGISGDNVGGVLKACYGVGPVSGGAVCGDNAGDILDCYWGGVSNTAGVASGTDDSMKFGDGVWPSDNASAGWGIFVNEDTPVSAGYYWKSLGGWGGGVPVRPELWRHH